MASHDTHIGHKNRRRNLERDLRDLVRGDLPCVLFALYCAYERLTVDELSELVDQVRGYRQGVAQAGQKLQGERFDLPSRLS